MVNAIKGFLSSISMYTIIPVPSFPWDDWNVRFLLNTLPLIGCIIGVLWYILGFFVVGSGLHPYLQALLLMLTPLILSGFLHMDGFADTCDAVLSGRDLDKKYKILKDPNIGVFGLCAVLIVFMAMYVSILTLLEGDFPLKALLLIPVISRCFAALMLLMLEPFPASSLGKLFKTHSKPYDAILVFLMYAAAMVIGYRMQFVPQLVTMSLLAAVGTALVYKNLKGVSGDTAGFIITLTEALILFVFACRIWR